MANYQYAYSSGSGAVADAAFQDADLNQDGRVDLNEFRNFVGQNVVGGAGLSGSSVYESSGAYGVAGGYGGSAYESAAYESSAAGYGAGASGLSGYESAQYAGGAYGGEALAVGVGGGYSASSTQVQQYATDAQGLFQDPNPQIIRRPAAGGVATYTQNIRVRFLQPPPVPPHGPLIIKEVRPPQPPPPPPLRIRQQAPPLPTPPPLVLRERPPPRPATIASQTVIRRLAALPVPPRSVIIERLPPLPPRPRDIIIERWVPYGAQAKRRTIVQRAGPAVQYARPRNIIIQYEPVQVRVVRQFQRLGVTPASPAAYVQQYGASLFDGVTLVQQARAAGVVEDISPPALGYQSSAYGQEVYAAGGIADAGLVAGGAYGLEAGLVGGYGASSSAYESSSFASSGGYGGGYEAGYAGELGLGAGYASSSSAYEAAGLASELATEGAFAQADINNDGSIDQNEFRNFVNQSA